jgi:hypothetical protein
MRCTILATVLGLASLAVSAPAALVSRQASLEQVTDSYMFDISIDEFITNRNTKNPPELDWSSNGCTASPDNPFGFDCMFSHLLPLSFSLFHSLFHISSNERSISSSHTNTHAYSHKLLLPPRLWLP